jgi:ketosteroid isomerase-like protein
MTETGDGTTKPKLDEEFLRGFSARWHAAWNSHDHHQVAALCTDDVEWHDPSLPAPGHGADVIAGLMESLVRACPDFRFDETEPAYPVVATAQGNRAVAVHRHHDRAAHPARVRPDRPPGGVSRR